MSVYLISTVFVSASAGGVTFTEPSSSATTVGAAGTVSSFEFTVASSDSSLPAFAFAFAFTSSLFLSILAGIVTIPVVSSIIIDGSVPAGSIHLPFSFFAVTVVGLAASPNVISSSSVLSSFGVTTTLPSLNAVASGFLRFSTTVSSCESCPTF